MWETLGYDVVYSTYDAFLNLSLGPSNSSQGYESQTLDVITCICISCYGMPCRETYVLSNNIFKGFL